ncbi:MAG: TetR/AcrR family transcriptional regulator [Alphaproteobacteria bacterium]|nr:TetR/AcrR family transcriptional regulator [Alphaproteobacteria bacterium]
MKKQNVEHATAERILDAAQEIFIAKGFEGSSINDIANKAKINKSLIYHHFSNKGDLWKAVKKHLLLKHVGDLSFEVNFSMDSFKSFLESFVTMRFKFYDNNPDIVRLITWQRLENTEEDISGIQDKKFSSVVPQIIEFQQKGEVRADLDPKMINYLIMRTASMAFMEKPDFFEEQEVEENKKKFLELVIESLYLAFSTTNAPKENYKPRIY